MQLYTSPLSSLSIHLWMDTWVVCISWLLYIMLLWTLRCVYFFELVCSFFFFFCCIARNRIAGLYGNSVFSFLGTSILFSKVNQFTFPPTVCCGSHFSMSKVHILTSLFISFDKRLKAFATDPVARYWKRINSNPYFSDSKARYVYFFEPYKQWEASVKPSTVADTQ